MTAWSSHRTSRTNASAAHRQGAEVRAPNRRCAALALLRVQLALRINLVLKASQHRAGAVRAALSAVFAHAASAAADARSAR